MLAEILPQGVVAVESFGRLPPRRLPPRRGLSGPEESAIVTADARRQAEFAAGRECAHAALAELGAPAGPVPPGRAGEPRWPAGIVGSLTHCAGYRACAVARAQTVAAIGIDAEPARPLPAGLIEIVAAPAERRPLAELRLAHPELPWDLLLFCAKEAVYKAWFPLTGHRLGFAGVLVEFAVTGAFTAQPTAAVGAAGMAGRPTGTARVAGRWLVRDGLALTTATVPVAPGTAYAVTAAQASAHLIAPALDTCGHHSPNGAGTTRPAPTRAAGRRCAGRSPRWARH